MELIPIVSALDLVAKERLMRQNTSVGQYKRKMTNVSKRRALTEILSYSPSLRWCQDEEGYKREVFICRAAAEFETPKKC